MAIRRKKKVSVGIRNIKNFLKGRLFEILIERVIQKAGFETNRDVVNIRQFTKRKTMAGRGGTYRPDVVGLFKLPVPFSYPLLLIGECKNYNRKLPINTTREFLGCITDIQQFNNINIKTREPKFSQLFKQDRYFYLPVLFAVKGFYKNPQVLMYVHGINFVSYENLPITLQFDKITKTLLDEINEGAQYKTVKNSIDKVSYFEDLNKINNKLWKKDISPQIVALKKLIDENSSRLGVMDKMFTLHIIRRNKYKDKISRRETMVEVKYDKGYFKIKKGSTIIGYFSIPQDTLKSYIKNKKDSSFREIVIFNIINNLLFPTYYKIREESRSKILSYNF